MTDETASSEQQSDTDNTSTKKKKGCGFWALVGLGVIVLLAVIGSLLPEPSPQDKARMAAETAQSADQAREQQMQEAVSKRANAKKVTAIELSKAYEKNEMAAQNQFGDQLLEVSGVVDGVDLDFSNDPVIKLKAGNPFLPVSVYLTEATADAAANFQKGQKITVLCESVSEVISMPQLKDCTPVQ